MIASRCCKENGVWFLSIGEQKHSFEVDRLKVAKLTSEVRGAIVEKPKDYLESLFEQDDKDNEQFFDLFIPETKARGDGELIEDLGRSRNIMNALVSLIYLTEEEKVFANSSSDISVDTVASIKNRLWTPKEFDQECQKLIGCGGLGSKNTLHEMIIQYGKDDSKSFFHFEILVCIENLLYLFQSYSKTPSQNTKRYYRKIAREELRLLRNFLSNNNNT